MAAQGPVPPVAPRYLDPTQLTEESKAAYLLKVDLSSVPHPQGQCRLWTKGVGGSGYPRMRVKVAGRVGSIQYGVHQVVYALNSGTALNLPLHDVSHRCHNRLCVNMDHLSYEPKVVNAQRNPCRELNQCRGHLPFLPCIF